MAVVSPLLTSPINVKGVSKSISSVNKNLNQTKSSFKQISEILVKKTKVRRQIFEDKIETKRRREIYSIRKEEEDRLEAPNIVKMGGPPQVLSLVQGSGRSFFGRILSTLGYLAAGWLLRNLPTWVGLGKEFIARIGRAGEIIRDFVTNTINVFKSTFQVLDSFKTNIVQFDLFDSSNRVKDSFDELKNAIDGMGTELENAIKLVTTPLTQTTEDGRQVGTYSGEEVPGLGTTSEDMGAYESSYTGPETSGGRVSPQSVYSYLRSKGISHNHALGITANIKGESDFEIGVTEKGDSQSGVGLFQYSNVRKPAFLKAVPDYKKNWKAQIDYAINEDRAPEYLKTQFSSPEEAAYWWMSKWERPAARVYTQRNKKHNDFIKSFKASGQESKTKSASLSPSINQSTLPPLPPTDTLSGGVQRYGASRDNGERKHAGVDFDISGPNAKFYSRIGGVVTGGQFRYGADGWATDIYNKQLGVYERIAEAAKIVVKPGQTIKPGDLVAVGESNTGVIHYEIRKKIEGGFENSLDPIKFLKNIPSSSSEAPSAPTKPAPAQTSAPTKPAPAQTLAPTKPAPAQTSPPAKPAQVSPAPTQQRQQQVAQQITPERKPQDIVAVIPQPAAAPPQVGGAAPSSAPAAAPSMSGVLNNFIKQKLLLDLAYL